MLTDAEIEAMAPDDRDDYLNWLAYLNWLTEEARTENAAELTAEYERIM